MYIRGHDGWSFENSRFFFCLGQPQYTQRKWLERCFHTLCRNLNQTMELKGVFQTTFQLSFEERAFSGIMKMQLRRTFGIQKKKASEDKKKKKWHEQ